MSKYDSYGGALYLSSETASFEDCYFSNSNSPFSIIDWGAIYTKSMKLNFVNVIFNNSLIYSNAKNAIGGAVSIEKSNGNFHNCIFINNRAETRINLFDSTEGEPRSLGGAVSLILSTLNFTECNFINNIGIGISTKFESYGKGGSIYAEKSNVKIERCNFITVINLNSMHALKEELVILVTLMQTFQNAISLTTQQR